MRFWVSGMSPRSMSVKLIGVGATFTLLLLIYTYSSSSFNLPHIPFFSPRRRSTCTPQSYADGSWNYKPRTNQTVMTSRDDALAFAGFDGCASDREFYWHLASDTEDQWDRFPLADSWEWVTGNDCDVRPLNREEMVKDLVEKGGWLLLGDSISEGHFFSLSCILYPHVRATPNYTENPYFDRAWPQNLYLNPESPLVSTLTLPLGFNISSTPLVTFRRVDLLLNQNDLVDLHRSLYNPPANFSLFSNESFWSLGPSDYMDIFTAPLPEANYATMVVSTGGHWTTTLLSGFRDESKEESGYGIDGVIKFFGEAMKKWAEDVQQALYVDERKGIFNADGKRGDRQVVVRAYLPGHEDCHSWREPWSEIKPFRWNWYNWGNIDEFNQAFEDVASSSKYPDIHYLPIERPGRLRPDAHATGDCLHIMVGAGVHEGWSHYIWHFVTRELGMRIR